MSRIDCEHVFELLTCPSGRRDDEAVLMLHLRGCASCRQLAAQVSPAAEMLRGAMGHGFGQRPDDDSHETEAAVKHVMARVRHSQVNDGGASISVHPSARQTTRSYELAIAPLIVFTICTFALRDQYRSERVEPAVSNLESGLNEINTGQNQQERQPILLPACSTSNATALQLLDTCCASCHRRVASDRPARSAIAKNVRAACGICHVPRNWLSSQTNRHNEMHRLTQLTVAPRGYRVLSTLDYS